MSLVNHKKASTPTKADAEKLLSHLGPGDARDLLVLVQNTGMRPSEVKDLLWKNVDLVGGTLTVDSPKTGRPRTINLNNVVLRLLADRLSQHAGAAFVLGHHPVKVFNRAVRALRSLARALGLPHFRVVDLRRLFVAVHSAGNARSGSAHPGPEPPSSSDATQ
jgi:integrase